MIMGKMDYWRLCDELSVVQAALLVVGIDPEEYPYVMDWEEHKRPENFSATFAALSHAILGDRLPAKIRRKAYEKGWEELVSGKTPTKKIDVFSDQKELPGKGYASKPRGVLYHAEPDWQKTSILVEDLKVWLKGRGGKTGFFFPQATDTPDFLDQSHKNYAPKLAAAIRAWQAVNADPSLMKGRTVKQALQKWLRKNADQFGLTKDDGNPNEQGIEEIAKISNWATMGGAPKTPG
jgi:hypothetical protein